MLQWNRMYLLFITLVFLLALGPDIRLLNAQETNMSMQTTEQTLISQITETSLGVNHVTTNEKMMMKTTDPSLKVSSKESPTTLAENVNTTSEENKTVTIQVPHMGSESTVIPVSTTMTYDENTTHVKESVSPGSSQTPVPSSIIETTSSVSTTTPVSNEDTVPTTTPTTIFTPTPTPTTIFTPIPTPITTTIISTTTTITTPTIITTTLTTTIISTTTFNNISNTTQKQTIPENTSNTSTTNGDPIESDPTGIKEVKEDSKKANWLIIAIIAVVVFCILIIICAAVTIKQRKRSGKQTFGYTNGQRSKKKKATEDDVWAGPVELGGGDCESPEEGDAQGEEKKTNGVEETGLSTFSKMEENGGVGRPGSPEVEKWEEKEPLLFIDEEGKGKGTEAGKSDDAKEGAEKTDVKEAEPNGGETFCLTTAV